MSMNQRRHLPPEGYESNGSDNCDHIRHLVAGKRKLKAAVMVLGFVIFLPLSTIASAASQSTPIGSMDRVDITGDGQDGTFSNIDIHARSGMTGQNQIGTASFVV